MGSGEALLMLRAVLMVIDRDFDTVPIPSLTRAVKLNVPAVPGVPLIAPSLESVSPAGRAVVLDQV